METSPSASQEGHSTLRKRFKDGEVIFLKNIPRPQIREKDGSPAWYPPDSQLGVHIGTIEHYRKLYGEGNVSVGPALEPTTNPAASMRNTLGIYIAADAYKKMPRENS